MVCKSISNNIYFLFHYNIKKKKNRNVISAWASGTGAAGVAGALTYAALTYIQMSPQSTLLLMLIVPLIQLITFCFVLQEPNGLWTTFSNPSPSSSLIDYNTVPSEQSIGAQAPLSFSQKVDYFPEMMKYVLPLFSVYVCEYLINQGLVSHIDLIIWLLVEMKGEQEMFQSILKYPEFLTCF